MKIAVTASGPSLEAAVDPRFGRCPCFLIVETDDGSFEAVENSNVTLGGGAGIQSARLMADKAVRYVLTGNCGPNAYQTLTAAGIGVIVGCAGSAADVIEQFKAGEMNPAGNPNVAGKFGLGGAQNPLPEAGAASQGMPVGGGGRRAGGGRGRGAGRGMGRGMGRSPGAGSGRGAGGGGAAGPFAVGLPPQGLGREEELAVLRQQAEALSRQMRQIEERIRQLEQQG
jgi:predicted Fe-Mo cluster-binding NifX family protein